jgi:hypothetical protein
MRITKEQLKQIIKEELQAVLAENDESDEPAFVQRGADQARAIEELAHDKVLYYGAKAAVDDLDQDSEEMSNKYFVEILQQSLEDIKDDVSDTPESAEIKNFIDDWLLDRKASDSEVYRTMQKNNPGIVYVYAMAGMIQWGQRQMKLGRR